MNTLTQESISTCAYMYIPYRKKVTAYFLNGNMEFYTREEAEAQLKQSTDVTLTLHLERVLEAFPKKP